MIVYLAYCSECDLFVVGTDDVPQLNKCPQCRWPVELTTDPDEVLAIMRQHNQIPSEAGAR